MTETNEANRDYILRSITFQPPSYLSVLLRMFLILDSNVESDEVLTFALLFAGRPWFHGTHTTRQR